MREDLLDALTALRIPPDVLRDVPALPVGVRGLLVYGSRARGDAIDGSDLDLLALVSSSRPSTQAGDVSISYYTQDQLVSGIGTLFGAHLKRDAHIVLDDAGELARAVEKMGEVDTPRLLARARVMSSLFTTPDRDLPKYRAGLLRQARYLLRSCLYARAIDDRAPCFSVRELASRHNDPDLARLLASRQDGTPTDRDYDACLVRLGELIGDFPPSKHGSLESTIVNDWGRPGDVISMAFMALGAVGSGTDYAEVDKILL